MQGFRLLESVFGKLAGLLPWFPGSAWEPFAGRLRLPLLRQSLKVRIPRQSLGTKGKLGLSVSGQSGQLFSDLIRLDQSPQSLEDLKGLV